MANNSQTVSLSWSMKVSHRETCFTTTKIPSSSKKHFEKLNYLLWSIHFQLKFHYKVYYPVVLNPLTPGSETWQILLCLTPHNFAHQLVPSIKVIFGFWNPTKFTFDLRTPCWWWVCQIKKYIHVHYKWDIFTSSFWSSKLNFSFGTSQMVFWQNILLRSSPFKCWPVANCGSTRSLPTPNNTVNLNIKTWQVHVNYQPSPGIAVDDAKSEFILHSNITNPFVIIIIIIIIIITIILVVIFIKYSLNK